MSLENYVEESLFVDKRILVNFPLFSGLSETEFETATPFLKSAGYKKGDVLFKEGDFGKTMFIHVSGRISAYAAQSNGVQRWMFDVNIGDFFGEMSIIANEPRSATLIAEEDTVVMVLQGIDFYRLVFEHPDIGIKLLSAISGLQNAWFAQTSKHLTDLTRWGEIARRRAITDELTGLYNRRFIEESIRDRFSYGFVKIRPMALLMLDLDKVHEINSLHGQLGGDNVFVAVAEVLRTSTRSGDICARLSGDEFSILLPDTNERDAKVIAERIRIGIFNRKVLVPHLSNSTDKIEIEIHTSIGIAVAPVHADTWDGLVISADNALRKAKELGRNRVESAG